MKPKKNKSKKANKKTKNKSAYKQKANMSSKSKANLSKKSNNNSSKFDTQIYKKSDYEFNTKIYADPYENQGTKMYGGSGSKQSKKIFGNSESKQSTKKTSDSKNKSKFQKVPKAKKEKKKKSKFSQKHPKLSLTIKIGLLGFLAIMVIVAGIVVGMLYGMWGQDFEISEEELKVAGNSILYDSEGKVLAELKGDENRKVIKLEEMAEYLPKAYVAIEDERFYEHDGVDYKRTSAAIVTYVLHRGSSSYGGSTITQQLVKNITNEKAKTGKEGITRKIKEWAKAFQIEKMLSKDQILETYLNVIFVGEKNCGVEVGAEFYFNKTAKKLSLEECAFLAGINNEPNNYNPYENTAKYGGKYGKDETKTNAINKRTKTVLKKMLDLGYIDQEKYDEAVKKVDDGLKFKKGTSKGSIYSYHTDATIAQVINDFVKEKGWSEEYATTYVYGGGLKIYSTQNTDVQKAIEKTMVNNASTYQRSSRKKKDEDGKYVKSQAAMVVIDNETGYVVGVVGGLGEKTTSRGLNRATQSPRQTGSAIKPIADVLPALQEGIITASTRYLDTKTKFDNGKFEPKNDHNAYSGNISIRTAIAKSHNIPFVKIMAELTNATSREYLKKMGITSLSDEKDVGLALAIGGLYRGISPLEMAGAYATIANDGVYRTPLFYTKVEDDKGNTVYEPKQETREVCSRQNAYILKDLLTSVVESGGTAPYCTISGMDVAAKTGTTNDDYDRWFCGFTNYYTGATWYGFDDNETVYYNRSNPSGDIWTSAMRNLHSGKKSSRFQKPDGVVWIKVCKETGLRATKKCGSTYSELFAENNIPDYCDESGNAEEICEDSGKLANEFCPNKKIKYFSYVLPKEKLKLWKTPMNMSKAPTEVCDIHNEETDAQSAKAPKITLIGEATVTIYVGDTYLDKGATAKDDRDGDLTDNIEKHGIVNTSKAGTYTITFKVKNSVGKEATKVRTIIVKDKEAPTPETPSTPSTPEKPTTPDNPTAPDKPSTDNTADGGGSTDENNKEKNKEKHKEKENKMT